MDANPPTQPLAGVVVPGRTRRAGEEVKRLIVAAARGLFAERGFAGATTRDIAARAGTSEALIFRYYGSKAKLFEEVIFAPFDRLLGEFIEASRESHPDRSSGNEQFVTASYAFLKQNSELLRALVKSSAGPGDPDRPMHGLDDYFARSAERLQLLYDEEKATADVPLWLSVRFGFGMLAAAILFEDWFFPDGQPDDGVAAGALARMLYKALSPLPAEQPDPPAS